LKYEKTFGQRKTEGNRAGRTGKESRRIKMMLEVRKKGALTVYHSILVGQCPTKMALEVQKNVWTEEDRGVQSGKNRKGESQDKDGA
jgi:diphthamide synthase subunit DPH2